MLEYKNIGLSSVLHKNKVDSFSVISTKLRQIKTMATNPDYQLIHHFPHRNNLQKCWYFTLFYYLVLCPISINDYVFPNWVDMVNFDKKGTNSKVSDKFKNTWSKVYRMAKEYCTPQKDGMCQKIVNKINETISYYGLDKLSPNKGIHSGKKFACQKLGDLSLCPQVCF